MSHRRILGVVLGVGGMILLIVGVSASYGGASAAAGLMLVVFGGRKATTWLHYVPRVMGRAGVIYGLPDVCPAAFTSSSRGLGRGSGTIPATAILERTVL